MLALLVPALGASSTWVDAEPSKARGASFGSVHRAAGLAAEDACKVCHARVEEARERSADPRYGNYWSTTMDAAVGPPDGISLWCLQCHDGSIAADGQGPPIGNDGLANDHPVSFVYDSQLALQDGGLHDPSRPSGLGGSIASDLLEAGGKMQCTACHDFHGERAMLLKADRQTTLCLACHDK